MSGQTFFYTLSREPLPDETPIDITVEYAITSWGCEAQVSGPAENCYPAEPMEIEVVRAWGDFGPIVLRDDEVAEVEQHACTMGAETNYGPDDWER